MIFLLELWSFHQLYNNHIPYHFQFYEFTQYRVAQFLVGIIAGYLLYNYQEKTFKLSQLQTSLAWTFSITFLSLHVFIKPHHTTHSTLFGFLYESVWRELWTLSICWIVFACHLLKSGGIVRWFLSLNLWQPLSRMSLSIYLINFVYIKLTLVNQKSVPELDAWWQMHIYTADLVLAICFGAILYLTVEAPTMKLLSLIWSPQSKIEWQKLATDDNHTLMIDTEQNYNKQGTAPETPPESLLMRPTDAVRHTAEGQSSDEDEINYFEKS